MKKLNTFLERWGLRILFWVGVTILYYIDFQPLEMYRTHPYGVLQLDALIMALWITFTCFVVAHINLEIIAKVEVMDFRIKEIFGAPTKVFAILTITVILAVFNCLIMDWFITHLGILRKIDFILVKTTAPGLTHWYRNFPETVFLMVGLATLYRAEKFKHSIIHLEIEKRNLQLNKNELVTQQEILISEKEGLLSEKYQLIKQRKELIAQTNGLEAQKENLVNQKNKLVTQKKELQKERDTIKFEKDKLVYLTNELESDKSNLQSQKRELQNQKNALIKEKNELQMRAHNLEYLTLDLKYEKKNLEVQKSELMLQKEKLEKDYNSLEIHYNLLIKRMEPHFLLGILNDVFLDINKFNDPILKTTAKQIMMLCNQLRYILYDCDKAHVSLVKEVNFMRDYIELKKMAQGNKQVDVNLIIDEIIFIKEWTIMPLMLVEFIENAFKYSFDAPQPRFINVNIYIDENDNICISVVNNRPVNNNSTVHIDNSNSHSKGEGLKNLQKRLQFAYPNIHVLTINDTNDNLYKVFLQIKN